MSSEDAAAATVEAPTTGWYNIDFLDQLFIEKYIQLHLKLLLALNRIWCNVGLYIIASFTLLVLQRCILEEAPKILANIIRLKSDLAKFIEPDFGLLDQLIHRVLPYSIDLARVCSDDETVYERNHTLLDLLKTEDQCDKFVKALQKTGQQHVVNFITQNGG